MAVERILVVDDKEDLLELISYNLTKEGYRVTCVATGEEAINEAKSALPDLDRCSTCCCPAWMDWTFARHQRRPQNAAHPNA